MGTKIKRRLSNASGRKEFSVGNVEELLEGDTLEINEDSKNANVTTFSILRIQRERQRREVGTFTSYEEIARIVISQEVIRKDLEELRHLQGWQKVRPGYKMYLPNRSMIQDVGG